MHKSQVNRAVVAARAGKRSRVNRGSTLLKNAGATPVAPGYAGRIGRRPGRDKGQEATSGWAGWRTVSPYDKTGRF